MVDAWDVDGWQELITDVGTWAVLNFGHSEVPLTRVMYDNGEDVIPTDILDLNAMVPGRAEGVYTGPTAALGALAPVLGLMEEIGEFSLAQSNGETIDAIGDVTIYMADAMYRFEFTPAEVLWFLGQAESKKWPAWLTPVGRLTQAMGHLAHVVLKRAQRIRDMHDGVRYRAMLIEAFADLANATNWAAEIHSKEDDDLDGLTVRPAWVVGREVFDSIVARRNWRS